MPVEFYFLLAGVVLLLFELIVPGFGIFGVSGMISLTIGGFYAMGGGLTAILVLLGIYLLLALVLVCLCLYIPKESQYNPLVLWTRQHNSEGYIGSDDFSLLLGKEGRTLTKLRPAGTVLIGERRFDVSSLGDYIEKDSLIIVVKVEGNKIFVEKIKE